VQKYGNKQSHRLWLIEDSVIAPSGIGTFSKKGICVIATKSVIKFPNIYPCSVFGKSDKIMFQLNLHQS
jgi:hypothetical protein